MREYVSMMKRFDGESREAYRKRNPLPGIHFVRTVTDAAEDDSAWGATPPTSSEQQGGRRPASEARAPAPSRLSPRSRRRPSASTTGVHLLGSLLADAEHAADLGP